MRTTLVLLALFKLAQSAQIYFHPPVSILGSLPHHLASLTVAKHLHLDRLTPLQENEPLCTGDIDKSFVGQGSSSSLLIALDDADAEYTVPADDLMTPLGFFHDDPSTLSEIIQTSLYHAPLAFSHVFDGSNSPTITFSPLLDIMNVSPPTETFVSELSSLVEFLEADHLSWDRFGAFRITGLRRIANAYGRDSEQYTTAAASLNAALRSAVGKPQLNLVIFTYPAVQAPLVQKRQDQSPLPSQAPVPPIGSDALCFVSEEICSNSTDSCSGHGTCVQANKAGRTCFACACQATRDSEERTEYWAGSKCERKDVSGPFVLITGTVVALILTIVGSIALLYSVGDQPLPSVLTGSVPGISARE